MQQPTHAKAWAYLNWPNRISLLRLLLIAPFIILLLHQQSVPSYRYFALGIFVIMGISDALDGYLARRLSCKSRLGAVLDPLADKALIICSAVLLTLPGSCVPNAQLPDWVVVLIVGKDLWVVLGFLLLFLATGHLRVHPTRAGKLSTAGQLVMVTAILLSPDLDRFGAGYGAPLGQWLAMGLWWLVGALSVAAIVSYTRMGVAVVAESERAAAVAKPPPGAEQRNDQAGTK
jgi:cardiolipin synthase (CMP-forming)